MGNEGQKKAGDVQVMSAGSGIMPSELNTENLPTKLFQIWLQPRTRGGAPRWGTKPFPKNDRAGRLVVLASGLKATPTHCLSGPMQGYSAQRSPQDKH